MDCSLGAPKIEGPHHVRRTYVIKDPQILLAQGPLKALFGPIVVIV